MRPICRVISIHAPREGSDPPRQARWLAGRISIHAPREGSDKRIKHEQKDFLTISIHAPREGSDGYGF